MSQAAQFKSSAIRLSLVPESYLLSKVKLDQARTIWHNHDA